MDGELKKGQRIGSGLASDVIYWEDGKVLKVFKNEVDEEATGYASFNREAEVGKRLSTVLDFVPKVYGTMNYEGRKAIIFEHIQGETLMSQLMKNVWNLNKIARISAEIQSQLHAVDCRKLGLDTVLERGFDLVKLLEGNEHIPKDLLAMLMDYVGTFPNDPKNDVVIHGDFHPNNIIMTEKGPYLIDWGRTMLNPPATGVCYTCLLARIVKYTPNPFIFRLLSGFLGSRYANLHQKHYMEMTGLSEETIDSWTPLVAAVMMGWGFEGPLNGHLEKLIRKYLARS